MHSLSILYVERRVTILTLSLTSTSHSRRCKIFSTLGRSKTGNCPSLSTVMLGIASHGFPSNLTPMLLCPLAERCYNIFNICLESRVGAHLSQTSPVIKTPIDGLVMLQNDGLIGSRFCIRPDLQRRPCFITNAIWRGSPTSTAKSPNCIL